MSYAANLRLSWKSSPFDRGSKHEAQTPFGPIIVVDDSVLRMCTRHPVVGYVSIGNAMSYEEAMEAAECAYFAAIETEYEERR